MSISNKFWYLLIVLLILISSCSDDNQHTSSAPLVVEAYLHIDRPFKVAVSNLTSVIPADVDHLTVTVSNDEETVSLNSLGGGLYSSSDNVVVKDGGGNYVLNFMDNNNEQVTALTAVPSKPENFQLSEYEIEIEPIDFGSGFPPQGGISREGIELTWENPNNGYYFTYFENVEDNPELINNIQNIPGGAAPTRFFRSEPTQESSTEILYNQFEYYGKYNVILFHVNADYAGLYKEQENSSSLNLTSPFTNVVNGLGIFTAIHSDTVVLNVKKP